MAAVWVEKLKKRWGVTSNWDFAIIFTVFAFTGSTTVLIKGWFFDLIGISRTETPWYIYWPIYVGYMLFVYQIILVAYGTLVGKFTFFWGFAKRFTNFVLRPLGIKL